MKAQPELKISIVIKALNEAARIKDAVESALRALEGIGGEVILADSGSADGTVEIASAYPVTIVQLEDWSERRCGIGPQLGFQFCRGEFVYILDGDMLLDPAFLPEALKSFAADPKLAGVAGLVDEHSDGSVQFRGRKSRNLEGKAGPAAWLDMGGLYRRAAIDSVGYFSNRNLFACEEQELGLRLGAAGWKLERLAVKSVDHFGHTEATLDLLRKRWKTGYLFGAGQVLRASVDRPWFGAVLRVHKHLVVTAALMLALLVGLVLLPFTPSLLVLWAIGLMLLTLQRVLRLHSVTDGILSVVVWHVNATAMVVGYFKPQKDPLQTIRARVLHPAQ